MSNNDDCSIPGASEVLSDASCSRRPWQQEEQTLLSDSDDVPASMSQKTIRSHGQVQLEYITTSLSQMLQGRTPRQFQIDLTVAQEEGKDCICQASTGMGKTVVAAAPHALAHNTGRVTLMISPLIALQEEMVCISLHHLTDMLNVF